MAAVLPMVVVCLVWPLTVSLQVLDSEFVCVAGAITSKTQHQTTLCSEFGCSCPHPPQTSQFKQNQVPTVMNMRGFASIHSGKGLVSVTFADTKYNNPSHALNAHQKCLGGKLRNKVFGTRKKINKKIKFT